MTRTCTATILAALALTISACGGSTSNGVPWSDYSPTVKARIDAQTATKDCAGLQGEFNTADAGNQATMSRTGHNNAELMIYINDGMQAAGC